ncbi:TerB N-terminal domain-containing protein [Paenibacillus glucanolyticus]|uniref:TerB N-terminal domain-containing protein n=1 Tax=Paenibacillus glucanolyticus TaxID=59843 RepID=UPI0030C8E1B0
MKNDKPNNDNHINSIRHTTHVNDQGIRFAEFELAGDEQDVSLPDKRPDTLNQVQETVDPAVPTKKPLIVEPQQSLDMNWGEDFRYVTKEQQFVQKARELAWHVEGETPFVAFKSYWPTYDQMTSDQFTWYFYWREEVRSGRYPDTDLSYLFVYFYELIHGVGWSDPLQGYEWMEQTWTTYRKRYAKLDTYLREWLYDFMIVHGLDMPIGETYQRFPRVLSAELKETEWKRRFSLQPVELTWDLLLELLDYDVEKSRFYQESGRKDLERYAPKVIALVDSYLAKMKGQRFIDRFQPRPRQVKRHLFRSAVYDHGLYGRTVVLTVVSLSEYAPLRSYITGLVRLTENKLRELRGFKGRLRGADVVEPEVEEIITRYLKKEIQEQMEAERKQSLPEVQIDTGKLRRLQRESDQVRDMLLTEEAGQQQAEVFQRELTPAPRVPLDDAGSITKDSAKTEAPSRSRSAIRSAPKKPDVFQAVMDFDADPYELDSIEMREQSDDADDIASSVNTLEAKQPEAESQLGAAEGCYMESSGSADDSLMQSMGSREEHSSEAGVIHGMDPHPVENDVHTGMPTGMLAVEEQSWQWEVEDEEWQELAERLSFFHLEALSVLKDGPNRPGLQRIAEKAGSMPALLLDEINEAAMDTIGDLLIDGESIADDYIEMLETLKSV